jgi:hypothetical protein
MKMLLGALTPVQRKVAYMLFSHHLHSLQYYLPPSAGATDGALDIAALFRA